MRLHQVRLRNFRCYADEVTIDVGDLTAFVGKNDAGKSSILDALAIFFDEKKPDGDDATKHGDPSDMAITCLFDELPSAPILDVARPTTLVDEYLVNGDGYLEISKVYSGQNKIPTAKTYINAVHPTADGAKDLLALKITDLKSRAKELGVDLTGVNQGVSSELRHAIRDHFKDLKPVEQLVEVDTAPGAKELYGRIREAMPAFYLFKSDRASTDQDGDAQDPMKAAVKLAIEQQHETLATIAAAVKAELTKLLTETVTKIGAMSPSLAAELRPEISDPKWDSVFKIALTDEASIPINKRGSGARRLVLLGFFQAQAESKSLASPDSGVIYAIEEPETSQHPDQQRALLQVLEEIATQQGYQVLLTTHTPMLGRLLPEQTLRFIDVLGDGTRNVLPLGEETLRRVSKALGVLPDHDVRVFVGIEGPNDEHFLKALSTTLTVSDDDIDDLGCLEDEGKLVFVPVGGSNAALWVSRLKGLNRPEFHLFDRDEAPPKTPSHTKQADEINNREDCEAVHTSKRELENYLHSDAITLARPEITFSTARSDFEDLPEVVARSLHEFSDSDVPWEELPDEKVKKKESAAKRWLNTEAAAKMTPELLADSDPNGDVVGWLRKITVLARKTP